MNEPLDIDLTSVVFSPPTIPLFRKWQVHGGVVIDEIEWRNRLNTCDWYDAVVYSANGAAAGKCRRLLTAKVWGEFPATCKVKQAANVHSKLYRLHWKGHPAWSDELWIGSRNLVPADSYHNVMLEVTDVGQKESLCLYMQRLWNLAQVTFVPGANGAKGA